MRWVLAYDNDCHLHTSLRHPILGAQPREWPVPDAFTALEGQPRKTPSCFGHYAAARAKVGDASDCGPAFVLDTDDAVLAASVRGRPANRTAANTVAATRLPRLVVCGGGRSQA